MKYAVMGVGGVGGYFGARLAADGNEVSFIARGAHAEAMRRDGLRITSPLGDLHIPEPHVPEDLSEIGFADIILFCVKLWDLEAAAASIKPLLSRDSAVIPVQNGVSACDRLSEVLGGRHVLGGVAQIGALIESPGVIAHKTRFARLLFGERDGSRTWRQECLLSACMSAGIEAKVPKDIEVEIWEKFVLLAPLAGACCFYRAPFGEVIADSERRARLAAMMEETAAIGRAKGIGLQEGMAARKLEQVMEFDPKLRPSMLADLEAGRRLELEWLNGEIVRLGQELGVATPVNAEVYESLKPCAV